MSAGNDTGLAASGVAASRARRQDDDGSQGGGKTGPYDGCAHQAHPHPPAATMQW